MVIDFKNFTNYCFIYIFQFILLTPQIIYAQNYCDKIGKIFVIVAHANDDLYFMNPRIKKEIDKGLCIKVVHLTAGYNIHDNYIESIEGSKAAYAQMIGISSPNWLESWEYINGKEIHKFILTKQNGQWIEIQDLGLPSSSSSSSNSHFGVTLAELFHDSNKTTRTINGKKTEYNWKEIQNYINSIFSLENPQFIFATDPYGVFFEDGREGQHPDHILSAKLVQNSDFGRINSPKIYYFKTNQINNLEKNLLSNEIFEKKLYLSSYKRKDNSEYQYISPKIQIDCMDSINEFKKIYSPYGWVCKMYKATSDNYIIAEILKDSNTNKCLLLNNENDFIFGEDCNSANYISITKDGNAYLANLGKIINTPFAINRQIRAKAYEPIQNFIWQYDGFSKLSYLNLKTGERYCVDNKEGQAILEKCSKSRTDLNILLNNKNNLILSSLKNIKIRNTENNESCLAIDNESVLVSSCDSENTLLNFLQTGQIQSAIDESKCLQTEFFSENTKLTFSKCSSNSAGQIFKIKNVGEHNYIIINNALSICFEIRNDLIISSSCTGYKKQLWNVIKNNNIIIP
ncbi:hypothetical protein GCL60_02300 [Silvanigrella paludirubra]|uniref:Ricin B lectin domain-containing protein n=1 Tax=Silvanigrella paludirubra TaxID=2499159 RepID=A0A6N6W0H9_9BACT|nr:ricin-type beta-trefoil lectin domain protein [Silvanigrella paludirubra]KAB8040778.1 hypothetical protein GCL60_02300 [Silvanigrella paludirubra]